MITITGSVFRSTLLSLPNPEYWYPRAAVPVSNQVISTPSRKVLVTSPRTL